LGKTFIIASLHNNLNVLVCQMAQK